MVIKLAIMIGKHLLQRIRKQNKRIESRECWSRLALFVNAKWIRFEILSEFDITIISPKIMWEWNLVAMLFGNSSAKNVRRGTIQCPIAYIKSNNIFLINTKQLSVKKVASIEKCFVFYLLNKVQMQQPKQVAVLVTEYFHFRLSKWQFWSSSP